jgi:hypothetical protein
MNYRGLFDEIDSTTCAIARIDEAIDRSPDETTQSILTELRKCQLRTRAALLKELHQSMRNETLELVA